MIKIENTDIVGWEAAIRGMRNPMNSWENSDSHYCAGPACPEDAGINLCKKECPYYKTIACENNISSPYIVGPKDLELMTRLRNAGTDHRKFMRMITVYADITAPLYWWKEFDTYKVGTVANSCSTMHKISDKEFTIDDFSCEHLMSFYNSNYWEEDSDNACFIDPSKKEVVVPASLISDYIIPMLNVARRKYNETDKKLKEAELTETERKYLMSQKKLFWWQMIQLLPSSYNQKRTVMLNYEVLANIYKSRYNHKLDEWRIHDIPEEHKLLNKNFYSGKWGFCDWIESLPLSDLITGKDE